MLTQTIKSTARGIERSRRRCATTGVTRQFTGASRWKRFDYSRSKELDGSISFNFCVLTRGPKADYERWAQLVRDDTLSREIVLRRLKKICLTCVLFHLAWTGMFIV